MQITPSDADGLIVRKPPEFVKEKCLPSGMIQDSVKLHASDS
jgi:hypothetical protein